MTDPQQPADAQVPTHDGAPDFAVPPPTAPATSTWPLPPNLPDRPAAPAPAPEALAAEAPASEAPAPEAPASEAPVEAPKPVSLEKPPTAPPPLPDAVPPSVPPAASPVPLEQPPAQEQDATSTARGVRVPVLAALLVVLLGLTGFLGWKATDTAGQPVVETSRTQALASARDAARVVFSYDYKQLAKDFAAGKAVTTGTFAEQYAGTTAKLLDFATKNKATVSADVSDASVVRASENEVVCLVFLNQTSSSSAVETPRITQSRLEKTKKRSGDSWLIASINAL